MGVKINVLEPQYFTNCFKKDERKFIYFHTPIQLNNPLKNPITSGKKSPKFGGVIVYTGIVGVGIGVGTGVVTIGVGVGTGVVTIGVGVGVGVVNTGGVEVGIIQTPLTIVPPF